MFQKPAYKILIIGLDNAGKTVSLKIKINACCIDDVGANKSDEQLEINEFAENTAHHWPKHCQIG
jgi:hypothetical protein